MEAEAAKQLFDGFTNFGLAGMLFYMWYHQSQKESGLQDIIKEQVEDKRLMREERTELIALLKEHAALNARISEQLDRMEKFANRSH